MRFAQVSSTAAAFVFCAAMMPVYAQHDEGHDKQSGGKPEGKQAAPARQERAPQAAQQHQAARPQEHAQQAQQARPAQQQQRAAQPQQHAQQQQAQQQAQQQQQHAQQPARVAHQSQPQQHAQQPARVAHQNGQQQQATQPARVAHQNQPQRQQRAQQPQQQQARNQQQPQRSRQEAQTWQQSRGWQHGGGWQAQNSWQGDRSRNWSADHRSWAQRGGYGGYYVPQESFNLYFGDDHFFRLGGEPVMYMGYPRFEYSGYSFLMVDPYPENWAENWYSSDDVYIDYDNGYYLHDRSYPGIRLAITVQL